MSKEITYQDENVIRELLIGHTVVKVDEDTLHLDDGRVLQIFGNEGCGGCSAGWYELSELNDCPNNVIMAVEFEHDDDGIEEGDETYKVFVLAEDERIKLLQVDGSDGNGYYGSGYWIKVTP